MNLSEKKLVMEKTQHLFEGNVYLISNHSVARNPMFSTLKMQQYFEKKMESYLSPISQIIAYALNDNEFQILVRLKERENFVNHFMTKKGNSARDLLDIPESTYIFSQAMANLQVSFVKHFNWFHERSGTLVAGRYDRKLVESEVELEEWISKLNRGIKKHSYGYLWENDLMKSREVLTSGWLYGEGQEVISKDLGVYLDGRKSDLAAVFEDLPPKCLPSTKNYFLKQINRLFGPKLYPKA